MVLDRRRIALPGRMVRACALGQLALALGTWGIGSISCSAQAPKLNVLIFSGQNNHDWRTTTPALKRILETSGRFTVDVTDHPEQCTAATLARYSAIVSNWNAFGPATVKEWPPETRAAVLEFVRGGKGFVVVHAGSSSFYDWREYQQMTGASWDLAHTGHGAQHAFYVQVIDPGHPVTHSLRMFPTRDELWHRAGTSPGAHPVATAYSSTESGGSGGDEPLAFVTEFGKGRCFTLLLGHDAAAMASAGFGVLLCRGAEWAATAKVTIPAPASFLDASQLGTVLSQVRAYKAGERREPLWMLEYHAGCVAGTPTAAQLAERLAALATDGGASPEGRQAACRVLGLIGSAAQVPTLAHLLEDGALSTYARFALERIPGAESVAALRASLPRLDIPARVGAINSVGARRDVESTAALAALCRESDRATVNASLDALGHIGTPDALKALTAFRPTALPAYRTTCARALVTCADGLAARGMVAAAKPVYRTMMAPTNESAVRVAALSGLVQAEKAGRAQLLLGALRGPDAALRRAAACWVVSDAECVRAVAKDVDRLPTDVQAPVIAAAEALGERSALPAVVRAAANPDRDVRVAALSALGTLGRSDAVPILARSAGSGDATVRGTAREALARLPGPGVDSAIVAAAGKAPPVGQRELIRVLVARSARSTVPALLLLAQGRSSARAEAAAAVGALGGAGEIGPMLRLLSDAGDGDRTELEAAVARLCTRAHTSAPIRAGLSSAAGATRVSLLNVLGVVGGKDALPALREALKSTDAGARMAAIKALSAWQDGDPLEDLLATAQGADDASTRALALRGVAQLAPLAKDRAPEKVVAVLAAAMAAARRVEDRRALVAAIGKVPCLDALNAAMACSGEEGLRDEAALAALQVAGAIWRRHQPEAEQAAQRFAASPNADVRGLAATILANMSRAENLATGAKATNTDGLHPDGQGAGPEAAIDGDPATYWDEDDNQKLYGIRVELAEPAVVSVLRIMGYQHHNYAPRDFDVLLDGKVAKTVENAQYTANWLQVDLPPTKCAVVELRITGYYGQSPAIRELEIYSKLPRAPMGLAR